MSQTEISEYRFTEEDVRFAYMQGYNRGVAGNPNHIENYLYAPTPGSTTETSDEAYMKYVNWWEHSDESVNLSEEESKRWLKLVDGGLQWGVLSKEEFIDKIKTDDEFAKRWGLFLFP